MLPVAAQRDALHLGGTAPVVAEDAVAVGVVDEEALLAAMIAPSVAPGEAPRDDTRLAVGWEVLVQYDWVPGDPSQPPPASLVAGGAAGRRSWYARPPERTRAAASRPPACPHTCSFA